MEAVIFDMDGVLIDTEPISKEAFKYAYGKLGLEFTEDTYHMMMGRSLANIATWLSEELGDSIGEKVIETRNEYFYGYYEQHAVEVKPGIRCLLDYLKKHDYKVAVATSSVESLADSLLRKADLYDYFDGFAYGSDVQQSKPHPEIFMKAAHRIKVAPEKAYVIEDSEAGLIAANRGNFVPIYIPEKANKSEIHTEFKCLRFNNAGEFQIQLIKDYFEKSLWS